MEDATGNAGQWLSPYESAWKIHATAHRREDAEFTPQETWTISEVPLPPPDTMQPVDWRHEVDHVVVRGRYVSTSGFIGEPTGFRDSLESIRPDPSPELGNFGFRPRLDGVQISSSRPFVCFEVLTEISNVHARCRIHDQTGKVLNDGVPMRTSYVNGRPIWVAAFDPEKDSKTLTIELNINRPREFEFLVQPPPPSTMTIDH
jgi:hypothetical protein